MGDFACKIDQMCSNGLPEPSETTLSGRARQGLGGVQDADYLVFLGTRNAN